MSSTFDCFIAIDWSGANGRYDGIAVAHCRPGRAAPRLVAARTGRWTRTAVLDWLSDRVAAGERLLVGFDFAFGLPFEPGLGYLGGRTPAVGDIFALWSLIESACVRDADFGCDGLVGDAHYCDLFRRPQMPARAWRARHRATDHACKRLVGRLPETVYKLIGPAQVGKASLTGIRVLRALRALGRRRVSVWPFEPRRACTVVEIFPTLYRGTRTKLRSRDALNTALTRWDSKGMHDGRAALSDHDTDALVSAAALRALAEAPANWAPAHLPGVRREGWIFGVAA